MFSTRLKTPLAYFLFPLALAGTNVSATELPEGGESLLPGDSVADFNFWPGDNGGQPVASHTIVDVDHPDFDQALRIDVERPTGAFWNGAIQIPSNQAVAEGDVMLIRLYFRSIVSTDESGVSFATVFPQGPGPEYNKYVTREITAGKEWVEYFIPFVVTEDLTKDEFSLQIGVGAGAKTQTFEIGGIAFLNYRQTLAIEDLPKTLPTYGGREPDAAWRAAAADRIEKHRKGDFKLTVVGADGVPLANTDIAIDFKRHAYHFGSVIAANVLLGEGSDSETYREKVLELFNQSGPENDLKWGPWIGEWGDGFSQLQTLAALQWLRDNGLYVRGHVMVWPSKRNLPELVQPYLPEGDPAAADPAVKQIVLDHIDEVATATIDLVSEWDVLNEPFDNHYLMDAFGDEIMLDWFARARASLPRHRLYLNDYSILSAGGKDAAHQQHFEDTIEYLVENDAPITGIGMQGHFSSTPTDINVIYSILERYHQKFPHLDIRVTEFDVSTEDEELQADFTRDFLTLMFSHPATIGVQNWGFWEGAHWRPSAAMYTQDWQEKPNAVAWKKLIYETWRTDFAGVTDERGSFSARGFYGDYTASFTSGGEAVEVDFVLMSGGTQEITIRLDEIGETEGHPLEFSFVPTPDSVSIQLQEREGEPFSVEWSTELKHWKPLIDAGHSTPGVHYRTILDSEPGQANFYRLAE